MKQGTSFTDGKKVDRGGARLRLVLIILNLLALGVLIWTVVGKEALRKFVAERLPIPPEVETEDQNGDGEPDAFFHKKEGALFRINRDRNFDGRLDEWIDVENEQWTLRKTDENYDHIVDLRDTFSKDGWLVKRERDLDYDSVFDFTEYYAAQNQLERSEQDTNGDGRVDVWKFFKDGEFIRREVDGNFDGKPDRWEKFDGRGNVTDVSLDVDFDGKPDKLPPPPEVAA